MMHTVQIRTAIRRHMNSAPLAHSLNLAQRLTTILREVDHTHKSSLSTHTRCALHDKRADECCN